MSGRLVAAITITLVLVSKPSISTRIWFSVCSRSSWLPPRPAPRWRPTASISSTKTMHGALRFAWSNRSRTRDAPTPTNISTNSEPLIEKKGTPASPATARERSVLPVPGGPSRRTPRGMRAPSAANFSGYLRNSTTSWSSSFASSTPATSMKVTVGRLPANVRARLLPKFIACAFVPCAWRMKKIRMAPNRSSGRKLMKMPSQLPKLLGFTTSTRTPPGSPTEMPRSSRSWTMLESDSLRDLYSVPSVFLTVSESPATVISATRPALASTKTWLMSFVSTLSERPKIE
jgi:hypothetical protein